MISFNAHLSTIKMSEVGAEIANSRVLARVTKELELVQSVPEPVLILNNSCLTGIPNVVLSNVHCTQRLRELCLKNNRIVSLVSCLGTEYTECYMDFMHLPGAAQGDIQAQSSL